MSKLFCKDVLLMTLRSKDENTIYNIEQSIYRQAREGCFRFTVSLEKYPYTKDVNNVINYFTIKGYSVVVDNAENCNCEFDIINISWDNLLPIK